MEKSMDEYIQEALSLFGNGYNCAQAVSVTFCDCGFLTKDDAKALTVGMEAGKKEYCGAVLGACLIAERAGLNTDSFKESISKAFTDKAGSVYCRAIKANKFSCKDYVALSASVLAKVLKSKTDN